MAKTRRFRRTRRKARLYRGISRWSQYNTLRTKCEYTTILQFPPANEEAGQPFFLNTQGARNSYISVPQMMERYQKNTTLREMFAWVALTGIRVEAIPHCSNVVAELAQQAPVVLAILPGHNNNQQNLDYDSLVMVNTSFLLDPVQRQTRYWSWHGGQNDTKVAGDASAITSAQLVVRAHTASRANASPGWNVKVTMYVYWRYAKAI